MKKQSTNKNRQEVLNIKHIYWFQDYLNVTVINTMVLAKDENINKIELKAQK